MRTLVAGLLLTAALLCGCRQNVDLSAVRAMAKAAEDAGPAFDALNDDYYASCLRWAQLRTIGRGMTDGYRRRQKRGATPTPGPAPEFPPGLSPAVLRTATRDELVSRLTPPVLKELAPPQLDAIFLRKDVVALVTALSKDQQAELTGRAGGAGMYARRYACTSSQKSADAWRRANHVYIGYFAALGKLAGTPGADDPYGLKGLATALEKDDVFGRAGDKSTDDRTAAFGTLASRVASGIFAWRRRDELGPFLVAGKEPVDDAAARLALAATDHYMFELKQEREALENFLVTNRLLAAPGGQSFAVYQYAKAWKDEEKAIDEKEAAAVAYATAIGSLRSAHDKIVDAVAANDISSQVTAARTYIDDLVGDVKTIQKAYREK